MLEMKLVGAGLDHENSYTQVYNDTGLRDKNSMQSEGEEVLRKCKPILLERQFNAGSRE